MKRLIKDIIIHCAATPNGKNITVEQIDTMHGQAKPVPFNRTKQWIKAFNPNLTHIGYHYFIDAFGVVHTGRHLEEVGAHVAGNNSKSIGICMAGTDHFTEVQWISLRNLIIGLAGIIQGRTIITCDSAMNSYKDMGISVKGHRDYSPDLNGDGQITRNEWVKTCPGFDVATWIKGGMKALENQIA